MTDDKGNLAVALDATVARAEKAEAALAAAEQERYEANKLILRHADAIDEWKDRAYSANGYLAEAEAEVARLREALERIAADCANKRLVASNALAAGGREAE